VVAGIRGGEVSGVVCIASAAGIVHRVCAVAIGLVIVLIRASAVDIRGGVVLREGKESSDNLDNENFGNEILRNENLESKDINEANSRSEVRYLRRVVR
jgi:hypothetical protein